MAQGPHPGGPTMAPASQKTSINPSSTQRVSTSRLPGVRMIVTPGSQEVLARCVEDGLMDIFCEAGAMVGPPGCGPCAIGRGGPLAAEETCIATVTRNDVGRMGSREARIYLASSATVAASAVRGEIADPRDFLA